jgi:hypothetical protein
MIVKDLKNKIKDLPDDMMVVVAGECYWGIMADYLTVEDLVFDNTKYNKRKPPKIEKVLTVGVNKYLYESEDLGKRAMWMTPYTYREVFLKHKEKNRDKEEEEEEEEEEDEDEENNKDENVIRIKQLPNKKYRVYW